MTLDGVAQYRASIDAYCERLLRPYIERLAKAAPRSAKELNDAVWQTVQLHPFEVDILDSPLLQRLRHLSQLGVVHWTYPSAHHSRLEHSIGVLHQLQQMIDAAEKRFAETNGRRLLEPQWVNVLRLSALCHDVGHGLMSHVVENAMRGTGTTEDLLLELADFLEKESCQLSEAAAYFMIGSPAVRDLVECARQRYRLYPLPADPCEIVQKAIVGKVIHGRFPLVQELISGPFDADKLDYMTRDALMTGVPVVTDIPRLIQKIRFVELSANALPADIATSLVPPDDKLPSYYLPAIALSGARTLDELMLGRTLLFDKVYRHQKVRAAETMVAKIVTPISKLVKEGEALTPLMFEDSDVINLSRTRLEEACSISITDEQWEALGPARDLAERLRARRLFVRAYAFSTTMPGDSFREMESQRTGLDRLARKLDRPAGRQELLSKIVAEVRRITKTVPDSAAMDAQQMEWYIALDPPASPGRTSEISRALLVSGTDQIMRFREDSAESSPWSNAYLMTRDIGYVFAAQEIAVQVFLACEAVLRRDYLIRTPASAYQYAKMDPGKVRALRRELTDAGYFDGLAPDLRSAPLRLERGDVPGVVDQIVQNLRTYEGVVGAEGARPAVVRVDSERVMAFLRQFREDSEVEAAIGMLQRIRCRRSSNPA